MIGTHLLKSAALGLGCVGLGLTASALISADGRSARAAPPPPRRADPGSLASLLRAARGGEHVVLAPGNYGDVRFPARVYSPVLQIDAHNARFTNLIIQGGGGVSITGGTVDGPRAQTAAVTVDSSRDVELRGMRTSGSIVGISVSRSQHVAVINNIFDGMASDGVNVAAAQDVRIEGNTCRNFTPTIATYDSQGKLLKDGNHPDCIQGWSVPGRPPLADITIIGNTGRGVMQGIFFGNSGQGGIDRIVVRDNKLELAAFNGIVISNARNAQISNNVVRTIPGSRLFNYPFKPITSWIKVQAGEGNVVCGNVVDVPRFSDDKGPCRERKLKPR